MRDLNDLYLFAAVVTHRGFSPAARALGIPKSKLSNHVARLEARLGVRLLERSTRRFHVTEIGEAFYQRCEAVLAGVEAAEAVVEQARSEPRGIVRVACPPGLTQHMMASLLPPFLARHPQVRLQVSVLNRHVDLVEERFDVALHMTTRYDVDPSLTVRTLGGSRLVMAASPAFVAANGTEIDIASIGRLPTLAFTEQVDQDTWRLAGPGGRLVEVVHRPRLCCGDFNVLVRSAIEGLGIALLPENACRRAFASGELVPVLPDWSMSEGTIRVVFTARQGLLPAVSAFIDHLVAEFPNVIRECREATADEGGVRAVRAVRAIPDPKTGRGVTFR